jgi:hypothetical protein
MSDASTKQMIDMYMEEASAPMFLSGFFLTPPSSFHNSEKVEIDVSRENEDVAVVIQDLTAGARDNESSRYTNKAFVPPVFKEQGTINSYDLIKRQAGANPFESPDFVANAMEEAFVIARKLENKIRRSIEWMAAQLLQTGALSLVDSAGTALYTLDYLPKATHMVTVSTTWATDGSTGAPLADLASLASVTRRDGKKNPTRLIFGSSAMQRFLANADVQKALDKNGMNLGSMAPAVRGEGATFQGYVWIGHYRFEMWMYDGFFKHPQTGTLTDYVDTDNVIMMSEGARLLQSYGAIPRLFAPDPQIAAFLPERMSNGQRGLDLTMNAWVTENREHLKISVGTRPLPIPAAIDTFSRLNVTA